MSNRCCLKDSIQKKKNLTWLQAAASSVSFLTASHVLASAGLDEQLMLLDRRSNSVAASVGAKQPLHSMACRDDGTTIAVGTSGACGIQLYRIPVVSPVDLCLRC